MHEGGDIGVVKVEDFGRRMPISFSTWANVVAAMKKISRLKAMSVSGTRLKGSSASACTSRIRMDRTS